MADFAPLNSVKCPHCGLRVRLEGPTIVHNGNFNHMVANAANGLVVVYSQCPNCLGLIIRIQEYTPIQQNPLQISVAKDHKVIWPQGSGISIPVEVPTHIAEDYREAAVVLPISPKASAALSRRCLQTVLREAGNTTAKNLAQQIDEVIPLLPTWLQRSLDYVREVGNFAAHPTKSGSTGEIVDVLPQEAEWNLSVLDNLFDFYYVKPAHEKMRIDALNQKLIDSGGKALP